MTLTATETFHAVVDGVAYDLKAGETFKGTDKAARLLSGQGLLAEKRRKTKKEEESE